MRRAMLAALSVIALALASPGAALAHHGHRGHHHKGKAKAHHASVRFEHFGAAASTSPAPTTASGASGGQQTATASPTEVVGTVTSFEKEEVLTITLSDGSTVKGKVTSATEIRCMTASPTPSSSSTEESPGDDKGSGDDQSSGDRNQQSSDAEGQSQEDEGDGTETAAAEPACGTAALAPGTSVREAELKIGPGGAEFESVELVK